jgi:hypothetical protein
MANSNLSRLLEEKIVQIEAIVAAIASDGESSSLRELRHVLLGLSGMLPRDPGIEMASDDVYAAGAMVVSDSLSGTRPYSRKQRLLASAGARLIARLTRVRDEALEAEAEAEAQTPSKAAAPALHGVVPFRIGFDGMVGPRPMCAPVL